MADLFDLSSNLKASSTVRKTKKSGGMGLGERIVEARKAVESSLGAYKDRVRTIKTLEDLTSYFENSKEIIAIDTETMGLNYFSDYIVGISMSDGGDGVYIPLNHSNYVYGGRTLGQLEVKDVAEIFKKYKDNFKWVYHNSKFDLNVLQTAFGYKMPMHYWDTLIFAHLYRSNEEHGLKYLYNKYIAEEDEGVNKFDKLFNGLTFDLIPVDVATVYAGKDAIMTYKLFEWQYSILDTEFAESKDLFLNIENPLSYYVAEMQRTGVEYDKKASDELSAALMEQQKEQEKLVYAEIDKYKSQIDEYKITHPKNPLEDPINLKSEKQLSCLFYEIIGYKTKAGKGTGKEILQEINDDLCKALLQLRTLTKLIDAFIVSLPGFIEPTTGRIHTNLNQDGTETGRFSSSKPNLQQIPARNPIGKKIRQLFKASDGYVMMSSDFSQQEPRVLCHLCQDEHLKQAYKDGKDIYAEMASKAFHKTYDECREFYTDENGNKILGDDGEPLLNKEGKKRRSKIKGVLLGLLYGESTATMAEGAGISTQEAQQIIDDFFAAYPRIQEYINKQQALAKERGYTLTLWGRKRIIPNIQREEFEFSYNENRKVDFNPMFWSDDVASVEVKEETKQFYIQKLQKANYTQRMKIIENAKLAGIDIRDNRSYIAEANRKVVNSIVQGSAADMSKLAMLKIATNQEMRDLGFRQLFPVHDEIIGECPMENKDRCAELMSKMMIDAGASKVSVPMKCDVAKFINWEGEGVK